MSLQAVPVGKDVPNNVNVIIESPISGSLLLPIRESGPDCSKIDVRHARFAIAASLTTSACPEKWRNS